MSGRRRHLIYLQQRSEALDAYGDATLSYTALCSAWAQLESLSAQEQLVAMQTGAEITHRATIDWFPDAALLTPADRILHGSKYYDIQSVIDPDGRSRQLQLMLVERL